MKGAGDMKPLFSPGLARRPRFPHMSSTAPSGVSRLHPPSARRALWVDDRVPASRSQDGGVHGTTAIANNLHA